MIKTYFICFSLLCFSGYILFIYLPIKIIYIEYVQLDHLIYVCIAK